jgi:septal ring factor EnvC (AmiA/AmiB activator)
MDQEDIQSLACLDQYLQAFRENYNAIAASREATAMAVRIFNRAIIRLHDLHEKLEAGQTLTEEERRRAVLNTFIGAGFCFLARDGLEGILREEEEEADGV